MDSVGGGMDMYMQAQERKPGEIHTTVVVLAGGRW
jgi:hypothetical protein